MFVLQIFTTAGGKSFNPNTWHLNIFFTLVSLISCACAVWRPLPTWYAAFTFNHHALVFCQLHEHPGKGPAFVILFNSEQCVPKNLHTHIVPSLSVSINPHNKLLQYLLTHQRSMFICSTPPQHCRPVVLPIFHGTVCPCSPTARQSVVFEFFFFFRQMNALTWSWRSIGCSHWPPHQPFYSISQRTVTHAKIDVTVFADHHSVLVSIVVLFQFSTSLQLMCFGKKIFCLWLICDRISACCLCSAYCCCYVCSTEYSCGLQGWSKKTHRIHCILPKKADGRMDYHHHLTVAGRWLDRTGCINLYWYRLYKPARSHWNLL